MGNTHENRGGAALAKSTPFPSAWSVWTQNCTAKEDTGFLMIKSSCQHQVIQVPRGQSPRPIPVSQLSESALGIATAGGTGRLTRCTGPYSKDTPFSCSPLTSDWKLVCAAEKQSKWGPGQVGGNVTGARTDVQCRDRGMQGEGDAALTRPLPLTPASGSDRAKEA